MTRIFMFLLGNEHTVVRAPALSPRGGVKLGPKLSKRRGEAEDGHVREKRELGTEGCGGGWWPGTGTGSGAGKGGTAPQVRDRRDDPADAVAAGRAGR